MKRPARTTTYYDPSTNEWKQADVWQGNASMISTDGISTAQIRELEDTSNLTPVEGEPLSITLNKVYTSIKLEETHGADLETKIGDMKSDVLTISENYNLTADDHGKLVVCKELSDGIILSLPETKEPGWVITIVNRANKPVTVSDSAKSIVRYNASNLAVSTFSMTQNNKVVLLSDGTNWYEIAGSRAILSDFATKASADENGNNIIETYLTKIDASNTYLRIDSMDYIKSVDQDETTHTITIGYSDDSTKVIDTVPNADKLTKAVKINEAEFDGSEDITIDKLPNGAVSNGSIEITGADNALIMTDGASITVQNGIDGFIAFTDAEGKNVVGTLTGAYYSGKAAMADTDNKGNDIAATYFNKKEGDVVNGPTVFTDSVATLGDVDMMGTSNIASANVTNLVVADDGKIESNAPVTVKTTNMGTVELVDGKISFYDVQGTKTGQISGTDYNGTALKAINDQAGNDIIQTYATKTELNSKDTLLNNKIQNLEDTKVNRSGDIISGDLSIGGKLAVSDSITTEKADITYLESDKAVITDIESIKGAFADATVNELEILSSIKTPDIQTDTLEVSQNATFTKAATSEGEVDNVLTVTGDGLVFTGKKDGKLTATTFSGTAKYAKKDIEGKEIITTYLSKEKGGIVEKAVTVNAPITASNVFNTTDGTETHSTVIDGDRITFTNGKTIDGDSYDGLSAKATADADGNIITETYLKNAGGEISGDLDVKGNLTVETTSDLYGYVKIRNDLEVVGTATADSVAAKTIAVETAAGGTKLNISNDSITFTSTSKVGDEEVVNTSSITPDHYDGTAEYAVKDQNGDIIDETYLKNAGDVQINGSLTVTDKISTEEAVITKAEIGNVTVKEKITGKDSEFVNSELTNLSVIGDDGIKLTTGNDTGTLTATNYSGMAAKATADADGRNIVDTYATKDETAEAIQSTADALQANIDTKVSQTDYDAKVAELNTAIENANANTDTIAADLTTKINENTEAIKSTRVAVQVVKTDLNDKIDTVQNDLTTLVNASVSDLQTKIDNNQAGVDLQIGELKSQISANAGSIVENLGAIVDLQSKQTSLEERVDNVEDAILLQAGDIITVTETVNKIVDENGEVKRAKEAEQLSNSVTIAGQKFDGTQNVEIATKDLTDGETVVLTTDSIILDAGDSDVSDDNING